MLYQKQNKLYSATKILMESRVNRWKSISKTADKLNTIINTKSKLPTKFSPSKNHSTSVDKLFNSSISRLNQSLQITAVNKTKEEDVIPLSPTSKQNKTKKDEVGKKESMMGQTTTFDYRSSIQLKAQQTNKSIVVLNDLKKEYISFKKNVMVQLDRQKQMIQQFMKQIISTIDYELKKIANQMQQSVVQIDNKDTSSKHIDEWKDRLDQINIDSRLQPNKVRQFTQVQQKVNKQKQEQQEHRILPPSPLFNVDSLLSSINTLRQQFDSVQTIISLPNPKHQEQPLTT